MADKRATETLNDWTEAKKHEQRLPDKIPRPDQVFVFGSNLPGLHGRGAAKFAVQHFGAVYGQGEGHQGNSYAIPTKKRWNKALQLSDVRKHVERFIHFARSNPDLQFFITRVGCGLAGFTDSQIAPLFREAPDNCELPHGWHRTTIEDEIRDELLQEKYSREEQERKRHGSDLLYQATDEEGC